MPEYTTYASTPGPKFDPVAVNKQIDAMLATVPQGKRGMLIAHADLANRKLSAAVLFKITDSVGGYARVSKTVGGGVDADAGVHVSFLYGNPELDEFDYAELVALFKARGQGWVRAHINAWRLMDGREVAL